MFSAKLRDVQPMLVIIFTILFIIIVFGPQIWIAHVMKKYSQPIEALPGNGGELATHLLNRFKLEDVCVEETEKNTDHYDPENKVIRLSPDHLSDKSLTAITIAAHEFGHALQDHTGYKPLRLRTRLAKIAVIAEKVASVILITFPIVAVVTKAPPVGIMMFVSGFTIMGLPVLLHLITLPVELDASFRRALPILIKGNYLPASAIPVARQILTAAALTYLAASLASLLNFYRWIAILRR